MIKETSLRLAGLSGKEAPTNPPMINVLNLVKLVVLQLPSKKKKNAASY